MECVGQENGAEIMSTILLEGAPVAQAIYDKAAKISASLTKWGITPVAALVRVGENPADMSYENSIKKNMNKGGVSAVTASLSQGADTQQVLETIHTLNESPIVHGIMLFRSMPEQIDREAVRHAIHPGKDVDGITDMSLGGVFTGSGIGFVPCTAQAVIELLDYYGMDIQGRNVVIVGRSLVVGRPAAMLLMERNATVTMCHSRTPKLAEVMRRADIVVTATGRAKAYGAECFSSHQIVIDVGINDDPASGKTCGDVDFGAVATKVSAITPVPGGLGAVTTAVLVRHVVEAAKKAAERKV